MARTKGSEHRTVGYSPVDARWSWGVILVQPTVRGAGQAVQDYVAPMQVEESESLAALPADVGARLDAIERKLDRLLLALEQTRATQTRTAFSVDEAAALLGKSGFTVREWCRLGRINASKRAQRRGQAAIWSIASGEIERVQNEGLLPADPSRNLV